MSKNPCDRLVRRLLALAGPEGRWSGPAPRLAAILGVSDRHLRRVLRDVAESGRVVVEVERGRAGGVVVRRAVAGSTEAGARAASVGAAEAPNHPMQLGAEPFAVAAEAPLPAGAEPSAKSGHLGDRVRAATRIAGAVSRRFSSRNVRFNLNPDIFSRSSRGRQNSLLSSSLKISSFFSGFEKRTCARVSGENFGAGRVEISGASAPSARVLVRSAAGAAPTNLDSRENDSRIVRPFGRGLVGSGSPATPGLRSDRPLEMHAFPRAQSENENGQAGGGGSTARADGVSPPATVLRPFDPPQSAGDGTPAQNESESATLRVLEAWSRRLWAGRQPVSPARGAEIRARMAEGWSERDLCAAVEGAARSAVNADPRRRTLAAVFGTEERVSALSTLGYAHLPPVAGEVRPPAPAERRRREVADVDGPICPPADVQAEIANLMAAIRGGER